MKKLMICASLFLFMLVSALASNVNAEKTGKVEKSVYADSRFGFKITALDNWKVRTEKEPSLLRVFMMQKNYKVSSIPGASQYTTAIPGIIILSDTTSLSLEQVEKSLLGEGGFLPNRDEFRIKLDLIPNSERLEMHDIMIDSIPARDYTLRQLYKKTGDDIRVNNPISGKSVIIQDYLAGHVILFKKDKNIYVVQFSCEREFFYPTDSEFQKIIGSWRFVQ